MSQILRGNEEDTCSPNAALNVTGRALRTVDNDGKSAGRVCDCSLAAVDWNRRITSREATLRNDKENKMLFGAMGSKIGALRDECRKRFQSDDSHKHTQRWSTENDERSESPLPLTVLMGVMK